MLAQRDIDVHGGAQSFKSICALNDVVGSNHIFNVKLAVIGRRSDFQTQSQDKALLLRPVLGCFALLMRTSRVW